MGQRPRMMSRAGAQVMVTQNRLPLVFDKSRPARFGVLPKRPKCGKEVMWFELPPGWVLLALTSSVWVPIKIRCLGAYHL
jgi:carotenoid cleavage dioxygenase-like enzyme